jgi:hypothetical protein
MTPEIISESFRVHFPDGEPQDFIKGENFEYRWSLTPSGDLLLFYVEKHALISNAIVRDQRHAAYARGAWTKVEILEEEEEKGNEDGNIIVND